jgi:hypothetical protein
VPGYVWGPSWVSWYYGYPYPLPPRGGRVHIARPPGVHIAGPRPIQARVLQPRLNPQNGRLYSGLAAAPAGTKLIVPPAYSHSAAGRAPFAAASYGYRPAPGPTALPGTTAGGVRIAPVGPIRPGAPPSAGARPGPAATAVHVGGAGAAIGHAGGTASGGGGHAASSHGGRH